MVTGKKPYTADTPPALMLKQATEPFIAPRSLVPDLPEEVEKIILKMLERQPSNRYTDTSTLVKNLDRIAHHRQLSIIDFANELSILQKDEQPDTQIGIQDKSTENWIIAEETSPATPTEISLEIGEMNPEPEESPNEPVILISNPEPKQKSDFTNTEAFQVSALEQEQAEHLTDQELITNKNHADENIESLPDPLENHHAPEFQHLNTEKRKLSFVSLRNSMLISILGLGIALLGARPSLFSLDRNPTVGFVQFLVFLVGLFFLGAGYFITIKVLKTKSAQKSVSGKWILPTYAGIGCILLILIITPGKPFATSIDDQSGIQPVQTFEPTLTETTSAIMEIPVSTYTSGPLPFTSPTEASIPTNPPTAQPTPTLIYEPITAENLQSLQSEEIPLKGSTFDISSDGQSIAVVSGQTLKIYDIATLEVIQSFQSEAEITNAKFSPDTTTLAYSSLDGFIYVLDLQSRELKYKFKSCNYCDAAISFSFNGDLLATTDQSTQSVLIWNLTDGTQKYPLSANSYDIHSIQFSPSEMYLAAVYSYVDYSNPQYYGTTLAYPVVRFVRIWNIDTGRVILNIQSPKYGLNSFDFSPDGTLLAGGSTSEVTIIWKVNNNLTLHELSGQKDIIRVVKFSPDGQLLLSGANNGSIFIWQVSNGELSGKLEEKTDSAVRTIEFSPDGKQLYVAYEDETIMRWQVGK